MEFEVKKIVFILISIMLYADISNILFKIKELQNSKKIFLSMPEYNFFSILKPKNELIQTKTVIENENLPLKIYAVFNNKVNINGKWLKVGENFQGYKIIKINYNKIVVKKDNKYMIFKPTTKFLKVSK